MRGLLLDVPESLIAERHRLGLDRYDEMWDGVLHMPSAPKNPHQRLVMILGRALFDAAEAARLEVRDGINVCHPERLRQDYRIPDVIVVDADPRWVVGDEFGVSGGIALAVELRTPGDEAYEKVNFYAERGVRSLVIVDAPAGVVVHYRLQSDGSYGLERGPGPIFIGFGVSITVESGGTVAVSCPAGAWRA
jgi:Uma2 family endonuclease